MQYRVGDIVFDMEKYRAEIIQDKGHGTYLVKHKDGTGYVRTVEGHRLSLIKSGKDFGCGDLVIVKKTKLIGTITETESRGGKQTMAKVEYRDSVKYPSSRFAKPQKELVRIRRAGDKEESGMYTKKQAIIVNKGRGNYRHRFEKGDEVTLGEAFKSDGKNTYIARRIEDGFEQIVQEDCFEEMRVQEPKNMTSADTFIDEIREKARSLQKLPAIIGEKYVQKLPWKHEGGKGTVWRNRKSTRGIYIAGNFYGIGTDFSVTRTRLEGDGEWAIREVGKEWQVLLTEEQYLNLFKNEEENDMGAELYGYPEDVERGEVAVPNEELAALRAEVAKLAEEKEKLRKENVSKEYGVVEKNHLWNVSILIPARTKFIPRGMGGAPEERSTEVVTEGQSMVEAAMVAEAMAKGISEDAKVLSVSYQRVLGALK